VGGGGKPARIGVDLSPGFFPPVGGGACARLGNGGWDHKKQKPQKKKTGEARRWWVWGTGGEWEVVSPPGRLVDSWGAGAGPPGGAAFDGGIKRGLSPKTHALGGGRGRCYGTPGSDRAGGGGNQVAGPRRKAQKAALGGAKKTPGRNEKKTLRGGGGGGGVAPGGGIPTGISSGRATQGWGGGGGGWGRGRGPGGAPAVTARGGTSPSLGTPGGGGGERPGGKQTKKQQTFGAGGPRRFVLGHNPGRGRAPRDGTPRGGGTWDNGSGGGFTGAAGGGGARQPGGAGFRLRTNQGGGRGKRRGGWRHLGRDGVTRGFPGLWWCVGRGETPPNPVGAKQVTKGEGGVCRLGKNKPFLGGKKKRGAPARGKGPRGGGPKGPPPPTPPGAKTFNEGPSTRTFDVGFSTKNRDTPGGGGGGRATTSAPKRGPVFRGGGGWEPPPCWSETVARDGGGT